MLGRVFTKYSYFTLHHVKYEDRNEIISMMRKNGCACSLIEVGRGKGAYPFRIGFASSAKWCGKQLDEGEYGE